MPLTVGVNTIVITATHKEGWQATATVNVTLPAATHAVTGQVLNQDSTPMRGILLTLDDGLGNTDTAYSSSDGSYSLDGTIGQADAGTLTGGGYMLNGGFWLSAGSQFKVFLPLILRP